MRVRNARKMANPKASWLGIGQQQTIPVLPVEELNFAFGKLAPIERLLLGWIVSNADVIVKEGRHYFWFEANEEVADCLAAFEAEFEDRELEPDDEPSLLTDGFRGPDLEQDDDAEAEPDDEPDYMYAPVPDYGEGSQEPGVLDKGALVRGN